jgi:predicted transcriptional regulator
MPSTTLSVRLTPELKDRLGQLSEMTRRTRSFLAAEAIAAYVDRESRIVEGIERGLADIEAGRLVSHADAMSELDAVIDVVERGRG